jgi:hypothetical protein
MFGGRYCVFPVMGRRTVILLELWGAQNWSASLICRYVPG